MNRADIQTSGEQEKYQPENYSSSQIQIFPEKKMTEKRDRKNPQKNHKQHLHKSNLLVFAHTQVKIKSVHPNVS